MGYQNKILSKKLLKAKSMTNLPDFTVTFLNIKYRFLTDLQEKVMKVRKE